MVEALFLVALAVAVTVAELRPILIAGVMALGWVLAAGVEWAAWRDQPHYASGLPPRWYVPRVDLPPAQPLEPVGSGYPEGRRDEAPTWIASADLRKEVLGDWPLAVPQEAWPPVDLPPVSEEEPHDQVASSAVSPGTQSPGPQAPGTESPGTEPRDSEQASEEQDERLDVDLTRSVRGLARYSLEPLTEQPRRRFGRGGDPQPTIDVPARPDGPRGLPGGGARED